MHHVCLIVYQQSLCHILSRVLRHNSEVSRSATKQKAVTVFLLQGFADVVLRGTDSVYGEKS